MKLQAGSLKMNKTDRVQPDSSRETERRPKLTKPEVKKNMLITTPQTYKGPQKITINRYTSIKWTIYKKWTRS